MGKARTRKNTRRAADRRGAAPNSGRDTANDTQAGATLPEGGLLRSPKLLYIMALVLFVADQVTKLMTVAWMELGEMVPVIDGWLGLRYVHNEGAAFSILSGHTWLLAAVTSLIAIGLVVYERKLGPRSAPHNLALGLILSGAIGNLVDRVRLGYVIDMIEFQNGQGENVWPVFNVADIAIDVGIALLFIAIIVEARQAKKAATAQS